MVLMMRFLAAIIVWVIVILAVLGSLGLYQSLSTVYFHFSVFSNVLADSSSAFQLR